MRAPISTGSTGTKQLAPEGTHVARCYQIIDKGTTFDEKWQNKKRKVQFVFELPNELTTFSPEKGEQPFMAKTIMNLSMSDKSIMRKFIESWLGKKMTDKQAADLDLFKLAGMPCMLNLAHNTLADGRTFVNIMSISPMPKGMSCPEQINPTLCYDTTDHDEEVYNKLPEFMQDDIAKCDEWAARLSANQSKLTPAQEYGTGLANNIVPAEVPKVGKPYVAQSTLADTTSDLDDLFGASDSTGLPF
jgi:hypothetical protein